MSSVTTRLRLVAAGLAASAVASLAAAGAAEPAAAASGDARTATRLLRGTYWTTYSSGSVTGAGLDRTVHLCRNGRFVLYSSYLSSAIIDDPSSYDHDIGGQTQVTGRWRVTRARLRGRYGRVVVRYVTDEGATGSVVFAATARGNTVGGLPAEVGRSSVC